MLACPWLVVSCTGGAGPGRRQDQKKNYGVCVHIVLLTELWMHCWLLCIALVSLCSEILLRMPGQAWVLCVGVMHVRAFCQTAPHQTSQKHNAAVAAGCCCQQWVAGLSAWWLGSTSVGADGNRVRLG